MRIIVAGSRTFEDYGFLANELDLAIEKLKKEGHARITIVSGVAKGADLLAVKYSREKKYDCRTFPANWEQYGKRAGYVRNEVMGKYADMAIVFRVGGEASKGSTHMVNYMKALKKPVVLYDL